VIPSGRRVADLGPHQRRGEAFGRDGILATDVLVPARAPDASMFFYHKKNHLRPCRSGRDEGAAQREARDQGEPLQEAIDRTTRLKLI
jgi:hypothetical protein